MKISAHKFFFSINFEKKFNMAKNNIQINRKSKFLIHFFTKPTFHNTSHELNFTIY